MGMTWLLYVVPAAGMAWGLWWLGRREWRRRQRVERMRRTVLRLELAELKEARHRAE